MVHLGQAAALRRYTPGSVTSALAVVPHTVRARARLRRRGVLRPAGRGTRHWAWRSPPPASPERTWPPGGSPGGRPAADGSAGVEH
ncbi:HXXEE domain-containing protein [Actinomadura madurae]|uniref:HXXEE domain-containing protein n=1 Tax=Actinomadura madurae TaxID=1993 RepID=UPI003555EC98